MLFFNPPTIRIFLKDKSTSTSEADGGFGAFRREQIKLFLLTAPTILFNRRFVFFKLVSRQRASHGGPVYHDSVQRKKILTGLRKKDALEIDGKGDE